MDSAPANAAALPLIFTVSLPRPALTTVAVPAAVPPTAMTLPARHVQFQPRQAVVLNVHRDDSVAARGPADEVGRNDIMLARDGRVVGDEQCVFALAVDRDEAGQRADAPGGQP